VSRLPYGIHCLVIRCFDRRESQFTGILNISAELSRRHPGLATLHWQGGTLHWRGEARGWNSDHLDLRRRRTLSTVIVSGHGSKSRARIRAAGTYFTPGCLRLPPRARLYLPACYQGLAVLRRAWARETGIAEEQVHGHDGETESALSTCLFLHLLEESPACLERRFRQWRLCNNYLRPHFPLLRRLYERCGGDPLATLKELGETVDLAPIADFVAVCRSYPGYLRGLAASGVD
jgi:hypothetical protein